MKKVGNEKTWGGVREGSGRPKGHTKTKISISVDTEALGKGLKKWGGKQSQLFEKLLLDYNSLT